MLFELVMLVCMQNTQPAPVTRDPYAVAYESGKLAGKFCVYVGAEWCPNCPAAKKVFRECAVKSNAACVELDDKSQYTSGLKVRALPTVIVYQWNGSGYEESARIVGADTKKIKAAMLASGSSCCIDCGCKNKGCGMSCCRCK
jgi:hypothetical protein